MRALSRFADTRNKGVESVAVALFAFLNDSHFRVYIVIQFILFFQLFHLVYSFSVSKELTSNPAVVLTLLILMFKLTEISFNYLEI